MRQLRDRRIALAAAALALSVVAVRHPSAQFELRTHEASDPAPHRFQAAVDIGLMAVSVIFTWTGKRMTSTR